ncbi:hypothetical protein [Winogradskyella psychrotolerans]|uniref:hypothetical protein n=1 Tax=Winogradskyella psychrotolerans TaxID=1344585 RepID=UPI001C07B735|nr:hypothetical protein [Winogradskyella psychrotolerans]MBU2929515.1 hypothetical protein [Winogradskyella psychrotolerans]
MFSTFFKQNKNKRYNYTPRYYDERKERMDNLKKKHGLIEDDGDGKRFHRTNFRDEWNQNSKIQSDKNTRIRLLVIVAFLLLAAYVTLSYIDISAYL